MRTKTFLLLTALVVLGIGLFAATPAAAGNDAVPDGIEASVDIEQSDYVDEEIDIEDTGDRTIYHVTGSQYRIWLDYVDRDDVIDFGIADGAGSLEWNNQRERYEFEPAENGTMTLSWETGEETYTATLRVQETDYVHRTAADDREIRENADLWADLEQEIEREFPDRDTEDVISSALTKEIFFASPFATFFQDIQAVIIMLTMRPGGWAILGVFFALFLASTYGYMRRANRLQGQVKEEHEIEEEKVEIWNEKSKRILQQSDVFERFPDDVGRALRDHLGENEWLAAKNYMELRGPHQVKGTVLCFMGQVGYVAYVEWAKHPIHGDEGDGYEVESIEVVKEGDFDDRQPAGERFDLEAIEYGDDESMAIIEAVPGSSLDLSVFDHPQRLDPSKVHLPIDNRNIEDAELIQELEPRFPEDFEDEAHMAECLGTLMQYVTNHAQYCDGNGNIRHGADLLSFMMELDQTLSEEADYPAAHAMKRELLYIANEMTPEGKLDGELNQYQADGLAGSKP